jgi:hypothetical protein
VLWVTQVHAKHRGLSHEKPECAYFEPYNFRDLSNCVEENDFLTMITGIL